MDTQAPTNLPNLCFDDRKPDNAQQLSVASSAVGTDTTEMSSRAPHHHNALVANAKIFPVFANRLASHNVEEYMNTAIKLKKWLVSEKAYYPDALRNIVALLEIAHSTFTNEFMKTASSALATIEIYQALIQAVIPFLRYFTEEDLQIRLQCLIHLASRVSIDFTRPARVESSEKNTRQEQGDASSVTTPSEDANMSTSTQLTFPTAQAESAQSPTTITTAQISSASILIPCSDTHADPHPLRNISPHPQRPLLKPQPKRRQLNGSSLSEQLKNRDLQWFKAQQQQSPLVVVSADTHLGSASPVAVVDSVAACGTPELLNDATATAMGSFVAEHEKEKEQSMPLTIPIPTQPEPSAPMMTIDNSVSVSVVPADDTDRASTKPLSLSEEAFATTVKRSSAEPSCGALAPEPMGIEEHEEGEIVTAMVVDVVMSDVGLGDESRGLEKSPSAAPETTPSAAPEILASDAKEIRASGVPETPSAPERLPSAAPEILPSSAPEALPSSAPETLSPAPETLASSVPEMLPLSILECIPIKVVAPSLKGNPDFPAPTQGPTATSSDDMDIETPGDVSILSPEDKLPPQATCPRFGGNMAVMMFQQGLDSPRGTITIKFNLDDTLYPQISRWANRKSSAIDLDLEQSVCVSFACYHLPSLLPNPPEDDQLPPFETLTMHSPCSWPTSGDLALQTKRNGKDFVIPLAPPIFVTPDDCVDVSSFIKQGENVFSVVQQSDMSEYVFMLHAHHPTAAQLEYVASCRRRHEDWVRVTRMLCEPEPTESMWSRLPS